MEASVRRQLFALQAVFFFLFLEQGLCALGNGLYSGSKTGLTFSCLFFLLAVLIPCFGFSLHPALVRLETESRKTNASDRRSRFLNLGLQVGMPLLLLICSDPFALLANPVAPLWFKDCLGGSIAATVICSLAILREGMSR